MPLILKTAWDACPGYPRPSKYHRVNCRVVTADRRAVKPKAGSILVWMFLAIALLPSAWLAWRFRAMPQLGAYHDDAIYLVSAKALASHGGYRILSLPEKPFQTKYPPVFPLLLSMIWRLDARFPENLPKVTALCWSLLPLYVFLVFRVLRRWSLSRMEAAGICALTALSPHVVLSGLMTMSELAFGVLLMTTLLLLERSMIKAGVAIAALAGLAGGLAFLTRTQAIALLMSAAAVLLWRRRWLQAAVFSLVFGVFAAGWFLWTHAHAYTGADPVTLYYVDYARYYLASVHWIDIPLFVQTNLDSMATATARLLFATWELDVPSRMFAWVVAIAAASGIRRMVARSGQAHFAMFSLASFLMFVPWNWPPNERYLLPLLPAIAAGFYRELRHFFELCRMNLAGSLPHRVFASALIVLGAVVCAAIPYRNIRGVLLDLPDVLENYRGIFQARQPAYSWIRENAPADARVLTYDDPLMYLYTGRSGYQMPMPHWITYAGTPDRSDAYFKTSPDFMQEHRLSYALVTVGDFRRDLQEDGRRAMIAALRDQRLFDQEFTSAGAGVFKLKPRLNAGLARPGAWWAQVRDSLSATQ